jgi:hypothetical protein
MSAQTNSGALFSRDASGRKIDAHLHQETPAMEAACAAHSIHWAEQHGVPYSLALEMFGSPDPRLLAKLRSDKSNG